MREEQEFTKKDSSPLNQESGCSDFSGAPDEDAQLPF